jgi:hypothetical protein
MMMAGMALGIVGAIGQFAAQKKATDDYNRQAAEAHRDASVAANNKYNDLGSQYIYNAKSLNQQGYKAALNAREEMAKGVSSSGAMGIAYGSNTLDNLMDQSRQIAAQNESNLQAKRDENQGSYRNQGASVQAEAQSRITATPFKAQPSPLGMLLGIGNAVAGGMGGGGGMSGFFGASTNSGIAMPSFG